MIYIVFHLHLFDAFSYMSRNYDNLEAVQQKIEELLKKKTRLRKRELDEEEKIELERVNELLTVLQEKYWQRQVEKENNREEMSM
jgi:Zn-dependent oligopeptidase